MDYKILGKTKLKVSEIGFGGIQISRIDENQAINLIKESYQRGINYFDTAHDYGNSEELLGRALKKVRNNIIISTKSPKTDKKEFLDDLESSLKKLRTDYIDIFLFHDTTKSKKFEKLISNGVVNALLKEKQKGKIRFIGFSCHNPRVIKRFYEIDQFAVIMIPVNFIATEFTKNKIYKKLVDKDIGILGMKSLGGGRLTDTGLCFKYISQFREVVPVVGMKNLSELYKNLDYIELKNSLDKEDKKKIKQFRKTLGKKFCRGCEYCMPCKQGIEISLINCWLDIIYKTEPIGDYITEERTKKVQKVDDCIECKECEENCPYSLPIVEMLKENRDLYFKILNEKKK